MFHNKKFHLTRVILIVITTMCLAACAGTGMGVHVLKNAPIPRPEIRPTIPLTAGLFIKPDIKNYSVWKVGDVAVIGEALTKCIQDTIRHTFSNTIEIDNAENISKSLIYDVIVVPELENVEVDLVRGRYIIIIVVKWTIIDNNRRLVYMNSFFGESREHYRGDNWTKCSKALEKAITDVFLKSREGLLSTKWWEDLKIGRFREKGKNSAFELGA